MTKIEEKYFSFISGYDQSKAERVLFSNILEALLGELAWPDHDAFQALISKELPKLTSYSSNSKLQVIKVPFDAFGQNLGFTKVR